MSINRLFKRNQQKLQKAEAKRIAAIEEWWELNQYDYPNLQKFSPEPIKTILLLMNDHNVSVLDAAFMAETFIEEHYKPAQKPDPTK